MPTLAQIAASRPHPEQPLQEHVNWYVANKYRVLSQTDYTAQLYKPKQFSIGWALFWTALTFWSIGLLGFFGYLAYHLFGKKEHQVYLIASDGLVRSTGTEWSNR